MDSSINSNKEHPPNVQAPATVNAYHGSSERNHFPENSYANGRRSSSCSNNVTSGKADDYYHSNARPSRKWFSSAISVFFVIKSFNGVVMFDRI